MKNFIVLVVCVSIILVILLLDTLEVKQEFSDTLHEDAVIVGAVYTPPRHDSQTGFTSIKAGSMGMDYSGNFGVRIGSGLQISNVTTPAKFAVVFKSQRGRLIISGKENFLKFKNHTGKAVDVTYREVYRTTYDTKNGQKQVVKRELVGYDFLDATLKQ